MSFLSKFVKYITFTVVSTLFFTEIAMGNEGFLQRESSLNIQVLYDTPVFSSGNVKHYLNEYAGKAILIVFWATWCNSCQKTISILDGLQGELQNLPFKILPISEDYPLIYIVSGFYEENKIKNLPMLYDEDNMLMRSLNIFDLPTSIFINADREVVMYIPGSVDWNDKKIRSLLLDNIPR